MHGKLMLKNINEMCLYTHMNQEIKKNHTKFQIVCGMITKLYYYDSQAEIGLSQ